MSNVILDILQHWQSSRHIYKEQVCSHIEHKEPHWQVEVMKRNAKKSGRQSVASGAFILKQQQIGGDWRCSHDGAQSEWAASQISTNRTQLVTDQWLDLFNVDQHCFGITKRKMNDATSRGIKWQSPAFAGLLVWILARSWYASKHATMHNKKLFVYKKSRPPAVSIDVHVRPRSAGLIRGKDKTKDSTMDLRATGRDVFSGDQIRNRQSR